MCIWHACVELVHVRGVSECIITVGHQPKSTQISVVAGQTAIWSDIMAVYAASTSSSTMVKLYLLVVVH